MLSWCLESNHQRIFVKKCWPKDYADCNRCRMYHYENLLALSTLVIFQTMIFFQAQSCYSYETFYHNIAFSALRFRWKLYSKIVWKFLNLICRNSNYNTLLRKRSIPNHEWYLKISLQWMIYAEIYLITRKRHSDIGNWFETM